MFNMRPRLRSFNHAHATYHTVFGLLHVRYAACLIGFVYLMALSILIAGSLIYNQSSGDRAWWTSRPREMRGPKISLKILTIPVGVAFLTIFYLFIGIIQQKANLLFPFVCLQIFIAFFVAILLMIVVICWLCEAKKVLHLYLFLGRNRRYHETHDDKLPIAIIVAVLSCLLLFQLWTSRAVCGCFRYFKDAARHKARLANYV